PKTILVNQVTNELNVIARAMRNALILADPDELQQQLRDVSASAQKMGDSLSKLERGIADPKGRELLSQIRIVHSAYIVNQDDFIKLVEAHKMGEARNLLLVDLYGYQNSYFALLDELNRNQSRLMDQAAQEVGATYRTARDAMLVLIVVAVLLSITITYLISHSLLRQLGGEPDYAAAMARRIAAGDLSSRIAIGDSDHSSLLYAMSGMRDTLVERGNALQDANNELAKTIEKLGETIDTLNRAREDLVNSEKLAALGSLVAGISHELNTPIGNSLMAASTCNDLTRAFTAEYGHGGVSRSQFDAFLASVAEANNILLRNLNRAADLVQGFKQVAVDRETSQGRRFQLDEVIGEILLMLHPRIKKTPFKVVPKVPEGIAMNSYPGPLGQVVINLVNNALIHGFDRRDAGTVVISAHVLPGEWVELSVHDDGQGIAPEHLKRIYDPFFTTKMGAGGSGLGLHIAYNIVTGLLAGKIKVVSEINVGTTFTLTLPLLAYPAQYSAPAAS
ncbi:MAG: MCP four helix bundle domain-containing protein, partial [Burkholderiaceae bacterium]|nr:MCP four helix bundle domain-containing protein [Burkholderiaceae bacterium]